MKCPNPSLAAGLERVELTKVLGVFLHEDALQLLRDDRECDVDTRSCHRAARGSRAPRERTRGDGTTRPRLPGVSDASRNLPTESVRTVVTLATETSTLAIGDAEVVLHRSGHRSGPRLRGDGSRERGVQDRRN